MDFKHSCNDTLNKLTIVLISRTQKVSIEGEKRKILKTFHEDPLYGGHSGYKRMYTNIRNRYYWPKMTKNVMNYIKNCHICKLTKPGIRTRESLQITPTPSKAFDIVQIDTVGPMRVESLNGSLYAVTMTSIEDAECSELIKSPFVVL